MTDAIAAALPGARAIVSLGMAATVSLIFLVSRSLFGGRAGNFVFLLATFASPLPIYANSVFPDSAAPFAVAARRAGGQLVAGGRIPVQALIAALELEIDEEVA